MLKHRIEFVGKNEKRNDYQYLQNTENDWHIISDSYFMDMVSIFANEIFSAAGRGIVLGIAKAQSSITWMTGSSSKWTPDISSIRSSVGAGVSEGGWSTEFDAELSVDHISFQTIFRKRDIVIGRHSDKKAAGGVMIDVEDSFGGAILEEVRKQTKVVILNANNMIGPINYSRAHIQRATGADQISKAKRTLPPVGSTAISFGLFKDW